MAGSRKLQGWLWVLPLLTMFAGEAVAATCTSVQDGNWNTASTWSCTGGVTRPGAADDVVIVSPHTVTLDGNRSATNLQIDAGATLDDGNGRDLALSGNAVINGTYDATGNNGNLTMTGNGVTLSGTGTIIDINRIEIDGNVTIPAGSSLNLTLRSEIRIGNNNPGTLTIDGALVGTGMNNGTRLIRLDNGNTSNLIVNGTIDAPNSFVEVQSGGTVTNNGTVSLQYLDGNNNATSSWIQGANSSLTLTKPAVQWVGTFDASAVGNTVTFNGTATPFNPATYYNIGGVGVACPHPAGITVLGATPCGPGAPTVTTTAATAITTVGATLNGTVSSNQAITTVTFQYGLTGAYGTTVTAAQSPLASNAVGTPVSAAITGLACGTLYHFRAVGTNANGTTNGADLTFTTSACPPAPGVVSINTASANPTAANTAVTWAVTFNTSVTGVNLADFTLASTGGVVGATLTSVAGAGANYTVTANTGTGTVGTLSLKLVDDDSIIDGSAMPLGGVGAGNGNFTGQAYTLMLPTCTPGLLFCDDFERTVIVGGANAANAVGTAPGYGAWTVAPLGAGCAGVVGNRGCAGIDSDIPPFDTATGALRPNATRAMFTRWTNVTVTSPVINLAGKGGARLSFWLRRGSDCFSEWPSNNTWHTYARCGQVIPNFTPTAGEEFQVQYLNNVGAWVVIAQYPMDDAPGQIFVPVIGLPEDALHANFQFRFAQPGGSGSNATTGGAPGVRGYDYWHVDNVVLEEVPGVSFSGPFCDTFEGDLSRWDMAGTGNVRIGSTWFQNGIHGMDLRWNTVSATTRATDLSTNSGNNQITFWVKRGTGVVTQVPNGTGSEYPDTVAKGLKVEYLNDLGAWVQLASFPGAGTQGQVFDPVNTPATNSFTLPAAAKHANFKLRITMLSGSGLFDQDYWHVDDVCVGASVGSTDLAMTMSSAGTFSPYQYVTYTMTVTNNGPNADPGPITITDTLPAGLSYVGGSAGWSCSAAGQDVTCTQTGGLASGASTTLVLTATVDAGASGSITNTATVGGQTNDTNQANNTASKTNNLFVPGYMFTDKVCTMDGTPVGQGAQCSEITWDPQTAGVPKTGIYLTVVNAANVPTALHATNPTTVNMQFGLSCHDPAAHAGVQATVSDGATTRTLPLCEAAGATPTAWTTSLGVSFAATKASAGPLTFNYDDVGAVELFVRNAANTTQMGSSSKFIVKPASFGFTVLRASDDAANPAAADATGAAFLKAGEPFKLAVFAQAAGGAVTPNYGNESVKEGIALSHVRAPGLGLVSDGTLSGVFGALSGGVMAADGVALLADGVTTSTPFSWSEVGILRLTASVADGSYNPGDNTKTYAVNSSINVGRFYPDHFDTLVSAPMDCTGLTFAPPCPDNGLVYSGQALPVSVQAKNAADGVTQNYRYSATAAQNFARAVTLAAVDAVNSSTAAAGGNLTATAIADSAFSNGTASAQPVFTFTASPNVPTDVVISATESGGDGVTSGAHEQGAKVVSGRIKVANAYGSEKLPLTVPVTIQYWDGAKWVLSSTDGVTQINTNLVAAGGNLVASIVSGLGSGVSASGAGLKTVTGGQLQNFTVNRPNVTGVVDLSFNAPAWLLQKAGQATFGIYKGSDLFIYTR